MNRLCLWCVPLAIGVVGTAAANEGQQIFERWCVHCHGTQPAAPGRLKLEWTRGKENSVIAERGGIARETVIRVVRSGQAEMPGFRKTEIDDAALEALVDYLAREPAP
jgi:mono/diheme cytochrome c family protein